MKEYLEDRQNAPANTYRSIVADCKSIQKYIAAKEIMITVLCDQIMVQQYIDTLTSENCSMTTIKRRLCTLRSVIKWCKEKGYIHKEHQVHISDNLGIPKPQIASESDMLKLYRYCRNILQSDDYSLARAKLECYIVILFGLKTSELQSLRVEDVNGKGSDIRLNLLQQHNPEMIENYLQIRQEFINERMIKSDALFVTRFGNAHALINIDFDVLRRKCHIDESVTLSSIRNACITDFCAVLENDDLTAALFEVTIGRIKNMRETNLLITLPCPVGTTVYMINENHAIVSGVIERFTVEHSGVLLAEIRMDNGITSFVHGKDFFLSSKDAEWNIL